MEVLSVEHRQCECCMRTHDIQRIKMSDNLNYKEVSVDFDAVYYYCDVADELYASEEMIVKNDISMKDAYRRKTGLLTSDDIVAIRTKYGLSQSDLCKLLGWGGKTITRYETHQVQDKAHDSILRKIDEDPEWFLTMLESAKDSISITAYSRARQRGLQLFSDSFDYYMSKAMKAKNALEM